MEEYETGAKRSRRMYRYDLIPKVFVDRVAFRFTGDDRKDYEPGGALQYGESNWERGLPTSDVINHIINHITNYQDKFRQALSSGIQQGYMGEELMACVQKTMISHSNEVDDDLAAVGWGIAVLMHQEYTGMFHDNNFPLTPVVDKLAVANKQVSSKPLGR